MKKTWLLDNGHGGVINGKYTTAPSKMYQHPNGLLVEEGVVNRRVINKLADRLAKARYNYSFIAPENDDIPLSTRVNRANSLHAYHKNCVFVSAHCNAGGGTGFEVYTSVGETQSDKIAEVFMEEVEKEFPLWSMRKDNSDGDSDKESQFYVLKNTSCPAILLEFGFMDRLEDAMLITSDEGQNRYVEALFRAIERIEDGC